MPGPTSLGNEPAARLAAKLSIILVNYRTPQLTRACLEQLRAHLDLAVTQLIVVDNNSNDESLSYLKAQQDLLLVERKSLNDEPGFIAHGRALDLAMEMTDRPYVLILHTDTMLFDAAIIWDSLTKMERDTKIAAVGCNYQRHRHLGSRLWRRIKIGTIARWRYFTRDADAMRRKLAKENALKSFFCLYDAERLRAMDLRFCAAGQNPSYKMQAELRGAGLELVNLSSNYLFAQLAHVQGGTQLEGLEQAGLMSSKRRSAYEQTLGVTRS